MKFIKGVLQLLQNINENKFSGSDNIQDRQLKIWAEEFCDVFNTLFNIPLKKEENKRWLEIDSRCPLLKKEDKNSVDI